MNKRIILFLAAILSCGLLPFTSCTVNDDNVGNQPYEEGIEEMVDPTANVGVCNSATYIKGFGTMPLELQQAVYKLFPNVVSSLSEAEVVIVDAAALLVSLPEIYEFYDKGGQLVCFYPDLKSMLPEELGYTDLAGWDELLWGGNSRGDNFYMLNDPDEVVTTDENGEEKKHTLVKDLNYWILRLHPLVGWIDYSKQGAAGTPSLTRADDDKKEAPSLDKIVVDMRNNSAKHFECNFPFTLFHYIDQATLSNPDSLKKAGSVSLRFEVMPLYAGEVNDGDAGDYYAVRSTVIPHNDAVWGPYVGYHGWTANRIYGYWFNTMDYKFTLVDPDANSQIADGLRFHHLPHPENSISARDQSSSFSMGVDASLSGGPAFTHKNDTVWGKIAGEVGFSCAWKDDVSFKQKNIDYSRNSSTSEVNYHWHSSNVQLKDDMDNIVKYYPDDVHQEFNATNVWMWHVPAGKAGVRDEAKKQFALAAYVKLNYSSWYHWRGALYYDENRKNWNVDFTKKVVVKMGDIKGDFNRQGWAGCVFNIPAPDRGKWGVISLKNASNSYAMRNVKIYATGEEDKEPAATSKDTYKPQEKAEAAVKAGTYTVTFELINPDDNTVVKKGTLKGVEVKMGRTKEAATTNISTGTDDLVNPK